MKSENDLIITGTVASEVKMNPGQTSIRFRIVHNFGGGREPLFLSCVLILRKKAKLPIPQKGNQVRVRAYLRMHSGLIEAVVKSLTIQ